ncbi:MAG TPA: 4Fe-4S dicluster domain-containing protein [Candidatus Deferrimicrobium sp.]|nr:4Fe-4S dicluster domain-containing protein [Candidatus Deferrimicrobium sp.]
MFTVFVNPERCIGCLQCELACAVEHSRSGDAPTAVLEEPVPRKRVHVQAGAHWGTSFPNKCRHCDPAPCQQVCPTDAIHRDAAHDVVLIDAVKCIGCAMCAMVCPFDVLTYHPLVDGTAAAHPVAVKCDGCIDRLRAGRVPACVDACKVGALQFGDLNELVAAGRERQAATVLAASAATATAPAVPETIAAWRSLGEFPVQRGGAR